MRAQFEARSHRRAWGGSAVAHAGYWRRCSAHAHATAELRQHLRLGSRRQAGVAKQESSSRYGAAVLSQGACADGHCEAQAAVEFH